MKNTNSPPHLLPNSTHWKIQTAPLTRSTKLHPVKNTNNPLTWSTKFHLVKNTNSPPHLVYKLHPVKNTNNPLTWSTKFHLVKNTNSPPHLVYKLHPVKSSSSLLHLLYHLAHQTPPSKKQQQFPSLTWYGASVSEQTVELVASIRTAHPLDVNQLRDVHRVRHRLYRLDQSGRVGLCCCVQVDQQARHAVDGNAEGLDEQEQLTRVQLKQRCPKRKC